MLRFFYTILFFCSFNSFAQQYIYGKIKDKKSGDPISAVTISSRDLNLVEYSSDSGVFVLKLNQIKDDFILKFEHQGYEDKELLINKYYRKRIFQDTIFLNITLKTKVAVLPDLIVKAERKPDTIFGNSQESVQDFIIEENKLILLTYDKTLRKGSKVVIKTDSSRKEHSFDGFAKKLYTDYANKNYLVAENAVFEIIEKNSIELKRIDDEIFCEFVFRINDSINRKYYYSDFQDIYPAFNYYSANLRDSSEKTIHQIEDKFMMELYRSEYKYVSGREKLWALKKEVKTGIDKEIWIGAKYFTSSLYYKELYAPTTRFDNEMLIFDHYSDYIYKIDTKEDIKTDSISINYHQINGKEKWKQPMLFDTQEQKVYALFQKGGQLFLRNINLDSGEITESFKIHYRFVENIKVAGNMVYYIYRPFESAQKKFLYSERLN